MQQILFQFEGLLFVVILCFQEIWFQFENCLVEGCFLLVIDCDIKQLVKDKWFCDVIQSCKQFINGKFKFKIIVSLLDKYYIYNMGNLFIYVKL